MQCHTDIRYRGQCRVDLDDPVVCSGHSSTRAGLSVGARGAVEATTTAAIVEAAAAAVQAAVAAVAA